MLSLKYLSEASVIKHSLLDHVEVYNKYTETIRNSLDIASELRTADHVKSGNFRNGCNLQKLNLKAHHTGVFLSKFENPAQCVHDKTFMCCLPGLEMEVAFRLLLTLHALTEEEVVHLNMAVISCHNETIMDLWLEYLKKSISAKAVPIGRSCADSLDKLCSATIGAVSASVCMSGLGILLAGPWILEYLSEVCGGVDVLVNVLKTHVHLGAGQLGDLLVHDRAGTDCCMPLDVALLTDQHETVMWLIDVGKCPLTGHNAVTCSLCSVTACKFLYDLCKSKKVLKAAVDLCLKSLPTKFTYFFTRWLIKNQCIETLEYLYHKLGGEVKPFRKLLWTCLVSSVYFNNMYFLKYVSGTQVLDQLSRFVGGDVELLSIIQYSVEVSRFNRNLAFECNPLETLPGVDVMNLENLLASVWLVASHNTWPGVLKFVNNLQLRLVHTEV